MNNQIKIEIMINKTHVGSIVKTEGMNLDTAPGILQMIGVLENLKNFYNDKLKTLKSKVIK